MLKDADCELLIGLHHHHGRCSGWRRWYDLGTKDLAKRRGTLSHFSVDFRTPTVEYSR